MQMINQKHKAEFHSGIYSFHTHSLQFSIYVLKPNVHLFDIQIENSSSKHFQQFHSSNGLANLHLPCSESCMR